MTKKSVIVLVLGISALELSCIPFWAILALPCAIIALVFAGKVKAYALDTGNTWNMARIGKILSIVALVCAGLNMLFWTAVFATGLYGLIEHGDEIVFAVQNFIDNLLAELPTY